MGRRRREGREEGVDRRRCRRPPRTGDPHLLTGSGLAFLQPEGNEAVGWVVGREADCHSISRDYSNSESPHAARQLSGHLLSVLESNLIAATAENLVDATGRLNQVISRQIALILPTFDPVRTSSSALDLRFAFDLPRTLMCVCRDDGPHEPCPRGARRLARGSQGGESTPGGSPDTRQSHSRWPESTRSC